MTPTFFRKQHFVGRIFTLNLKADEILAWPPTFSVNARPLGCGHQIGGIVQRHDLPQFSVLLGHGEVRLFIFCGNHAIITCKHVSFLTIDPLWLTMIYSDNLWSIMMLDLNEYSFPLIKQNNRFLMFFLCSFQLFFKAVAFNPGALPVRSEGFARSCTNAIIDSSF